MNRALSRDDLRPRGPGGQWQGVLMSVLVHAGLLAVLLLGFRWQAPQPSAASAELWAAPPQAAAPVVAPEPPRELPTPRVVTPAPTVRPDIERPDADIALERARKAKAEEERLKQERQAKEERELRDKRKRQEEADRAEKLAKAEQAAKVEKARAAEAAAAADKAAKAKLDAQRREQAAAERDLARQREENLARMMGQLGSAGASGSGTDARGTAAQGGGGGAPSASYAGRLVAAIKPNIVFADTPAGNPAAEVEVRTGPGGTILGRTLLKSSGNAEWDNAVLRAIDRTGTLPKDTDGRVPARLAITFRPKD